MKIKQSIKNIIIASLWGFLVTIIVYFFGMFVATRFFIDPTKEIAFTNYLCGMTFLASFLIFYEKKQTLISKYNDSLELLYKHVGFTENWVVYPIDDCTEMFWSTDEKTVKYAKSVEDYKDFYSKGYEDEIYTQRFYKKHIYRGKDLTMIFCDPHVDGMRYFRIFDNKKEQKS